MICYRDMTFCSVAPKCKNRIGCYRHFDAVQRTRAEGWAISMGMVEDGEPSPLVAYSDFSKSCTSYEPEMGIK